MPRLDIIAQQDGAQLAFNPLPGGESWLITSPDIPPAYLARVKTLHQDLDEALRAARQIARRCRTACTIVVTGEDGRVRRALEVAVIERDLAVDELSAE